MRGSRSAATRNLLVKRRRSGSACFHWPEYFIVRLQHHAYFPGHVSVDGRLQVTSDGRLIIDDVRPSDQGDYVCAAVNTAGSTLAKAALRVNSNCKCHTQNTLLNTVISTSTSNTAREQTRRKEPETAIRGTSKTPTKIRIKKKHLVKQHSSCLPTTSDSNRRVES